MATSEETPDQIDPQLLAAAQNDEASTLVDTLRARTVTLNVEVRKRDTTINELRGQLDEAHGRLSELLERVAKLEDAQVGDKKDET